jgi:hypothetical protein
VIVIEIVSVTSISPDRDSGGVPNPKAKGNGAAVLLVALTLKLTVAAWQMPPLSKEASNTPPIRKVKLLIFCSLNYTLKF